MQQATKWTCLLEQPASCEWCHTRLPKHDFAHGHRILLRSFVVSLPAMVKGEAHFPIPFDMLFRLPNELYASGSWLYPTGNFLNVTYVTLSQSWNRKERPAGQRVVWKRLDDRWSRRRRLATHPYGLSVNMTVARSTSFCQRGQFHEFLRKSDDSNGAVSPLSCWHW